MSFVKCQVPLQKVSLQSDWWKKHIVSVYMRKIEMVAQIILTSYVEILDEDGAIYSIWNKVLASDTFKICPENSHSLEISMQNKETALMSFIWNQPTSRKENLASLKRINPVSFF